MRIFIFSLLLALSACTIEIKDNRETDSKPVTREELIKAFAQRDQAIMALSQAINALKQDPKKENKK